MKRLEILNDLAAVFRWIARLNMHEGIANHLSACLPESNKIAACIGNRQIMLLANHGILTAGQTVAQAFDDIYYFKKACETYITALSTHKELKVASPEVAEKTAQD